MKKDLCGKNGKEKMCTRACTYARKFIPNRIFAEFAMNIKFKVEFEFQMKIKINKNNSIFLFGLYAFEFLPALCMVLSF